MAKLQNAIESSSLVEIVDRILDKGIVIDIWAKVSLIGIELLTIQARIVIASVDTFLRYAAAIGLIEPTTEPAPLPVPDPIPEPLPDPVRRAPVVMPVAVPVTP